MIIFSIFSSLSQEIRVIDNKGTIETINNNSVTTSNTAPTNPVEGDTWYDTSGTTSVTKTYDGTNWIANSTNVYTGFFIISGSGPVSVTGIPFQPSQVTFVAHANVESLDIGTEDTGADAGASIGNNARGIYNSFGTMNGFARANNDGTTTQQVIYVGGHGNSINDISRYASRTNCIGVRFGNQNGDSLGIIRASFGGFTSSGFNLTATYINGTVSASTTSTNLVVRVRPDDVQNEDLVVLFTAYR
ncbi:MAG: hypothetical protein HKP48_10830 [Winogradskyella sp.]|uniref:hypothetical protein n=1 Tax=Winogradskyella sp. TaxID=1883156 RepID=UPI001836F045|nr:hypothetical protein [Winogradskyella sp.]MBT8244062.1 hypothetical protein [Winogradskyella sp.]NNK23755.1 hypothetical protein [Winogradskyella sp.]